MNMEQIPLFEDEFMLSNDAAAALKALRLDDALEALQRFRELYRGGKDVETKFKIASFLKEGLSAAPLSGADRPPYLFHVWRSFEAFCRSLGPDGATVAELRRPFFRTIVAAIEECRLADSAFLAEGIPVGYAHLQTGDHDRAIRSLQACLTANNYFWRTYTKQEIDFVEERGGRLYGFEMKWGKARNRPPREWATAYPEAAWQVVNRENYLEFI